MQVTVKKTYSKVNPPISVSSLNSKVNFQSITELTYDVNCKSNPTLWVLYFYGSLPGKKSGKRILTNVWFFATEDEQISALEMIVSKHPHITFK